ncbi:MAG: hypothetical protein IPH34_14310 [Chitinophagaceae bacterium]|nr:hypothetical protein [Chitinophagaceae bacterium]
MPKKSLKVWRSLKNENGKYLQHVKQYKQHGSVGFVCKYLFDWMKNGYYNNRFEVEARESEKDKTLMNGVIFL